MTVCKDKLIERKRANGYVDQTANKDSTRDDKEVFEQTVDKKVLVGAAWVWKTAFARAIVYKGRIDKEIRKETSSDLRVWKTLLCGATLSVGGVRNVPESHLIFCVVYYSNDIHSLCHVRNAHCHTHVAG